MKHRVSQIKIIESPQSVSVNWKTDDVFVKVGTLPRQAGLQIAAFFRSEADLPPATEKYPVSGLAEIHYREVDLPVRVTSVKRSTGIKMTLYLLHPKEAGIQLSEPKSDSSLIDWVKQWVDTDSRKRQLVPAARENVAMAA